MADYTVKRIDDVEAIYWGSFKRVRADLGLESFGVQVMDLPPNADAYPEHDHAEDGQEELYVVLRGSADIDIDGETHALDSDTLAAIKSGTKRKIRPGADGVRLLIVGGVPGRPYEAPEMTELGAPDPVAGQAPPFA